MTQKLLLAEALDILRRTEAREYEIDRSQVRISSSNKYRHELCRLVQAYDSVYTDYIRGMEIMNYVRRCTMNGYSLTNDKLIEMCEGKMKTYMDRCEMVRKKKDNILLPLDQLDQYVAKGLFDLASPLFVLDSTIYAVKHNEPFVRKEKLKDGSYLLVVKNMDSYSLAAPLLTVFVEVIPERGQPQQLKKVVPCQCGWQRVIGVVSPATLSLVVRSKGLLRDSHVDVAFYCLDPATAAKKQVEPPGVEAEKLLAQLPRITNDELAQLASARIPTERLPGVKTHAGSVEQNTVQPPPSLNAPHVPAGKQTPPAVPDPIEVNPAALTCVGRLQRLRNTLDTWPDNGVVTAALTKEQQYVLQSVFALPFPTEIAE